MRPPSTDAPQADRLDLVRRVVEAIKAGSPSTADVAAAAQVASRYAQYCLHAARVLGLIQPSDNAQHGRITPLGDSLLETPRGSAKERELLRAAMMRSAALQPFATLVLAQEPPSAEQVAEVFMRAQQMALSTALRRARTLLAWRRYVLPDAPTAQLSMMFEANEWSEELASVPPEVPIGGRPPSSARQPEVENGNAELDVPNLADTANTPLPNAIEPPASSVEPQAVSPSEMVVPATPSAEATTDDLAQGELLRPNDLAYLRRQIEQGALVLFTGAGFSLGARDRNGRILPTGGAYAAELWDLCYPGEKFDGSSLQDVFENAQRRNAAALRASLATRFAVDEGSLPQAYAQWHSLPWVRIYTLNIDDLERAVERRFDVPRRLHSISAIDALDSSDGESLDVVHLNGMAADGPDKVTFSQEQYAQRIARQEPLYARLAAEMLTSPFVFVGSPLEEPLLWTHVGLRGQRSTDSENEQRPKSFLISPSLSKARADRLRAYNIVWVKATADEFARKVLPSLGDAAERGRARVVARRAADVADERNIFEVTAATPPLRRTEFLMGEEPNWFDIASGRAITRDEDEARLAKIAAAALAPRSPTKIPPVFAVSATAGAGKTTLLMRIALRLVGAGHRVAWVGATAEVAPAALTRYYRENDRPPILIIDDAGRYNRELLPTLLSLVKSDGVAMIILALRSYHNVGR